MTLEEAEKLRKGSRVIWEDEDTGLGPYLGTVQKKESDRIVFKWDGEDDEESAELDEVYYLGCISKVRR